MEAQLQETFAAYPRPALLVTHNIEEAYRLGEQLLVLSHGRVAAFGAKEEIFRSPPTLEVARLTGCKNFSRARALSENTVEALDWNCTLRVSRAAQRPPAHVGIRAHHIDLPTRPPAGGENGRKCVSLLAGAFFGNAVSGDTLPVAAASLRAAVAKTALQAEVSKEKWLLFRDKPLPWHVRLSPDSLFLMPE